MILLDTSGLFAALVANQEAHAAARAVLERERPPLVLSPFVLAELDALLLREGGVDAELALLSEIAGGAYDLVPFAEVDVHAAAEVVQANRDLDVGLADAFLVVLAGVFGTDRLLTLDERRFRALRTPQGRPFTLLPADA